MLPPSSTTTASNLSRKFTTREVILAERRNAPTCFVALRGFNIFRYTLLKYEAFYLYPCARLR